MIRIPKFFHEILGESQKKIELICIILFAVLSTTFIIIFYADFLNTFSLLSQGMLLLLTLDITGGVIANLSFGTDQFYSQRKKARIVFIAIHIQPLLIFLFTRQPLWIGIILWAYTILGALVLERFKNHPSQKVLAGFNLFVGLVLLFGFQSSLTPFVTFLMLLFLFKVLYSFSVNHHNGGASE